MSLGELYTPSGKALEHAEAVLEVDEPMAVNVAYGCPLGCSYCYGPSATFQSRKNWKDVRYPKRNAYELVKEQIENGVEPDGVFISFLTEPLLNQVSETTEKLAKFLVSEGIEVAVSSKLDTVSVSGVRHGMTIVSLDEGFWREYEGGIKPKKRVELLREKSKQNEYTWVSMEPCPCSNIWEQDIREVLKSLNFVDFIIKGKWNYDERATSEDMRREYQDIFHDFSKFCGDYGIRHHIKRKTEEWMKEASENE